MTRKLFTFAALGVISAGALLAGGCASSTGGRPYGLTGDTDASTPQSRARWTDDKGHYHAEWANGINRPAAYPK